MFFPILIARIFCSEECSPVKNENAEKAKALDFLITNTISKKLFGIINESSENFMSYKKTWQTAFQRKRNYNFMDQIIKNVKETRDETYKNFYNRLTRVCRYFRSDNDASSYSTGISVEYQETSCRIEKKDNIEMNSNSISKHIGEWLEKKKSDYLKINKKNWILAM